MRVPAVFAPITVQMPEGIRPTALPHADYPVVFAVKPGTQWIFLIEVTVTAIAIPD